MKCQILVDWLTFSVKRKEPKEVIRDFLGLDSGLFQEEGYGLMGYTRVLKFSNILVCYEPREDGYFQDMGVCVSMSGNGCRTFEALSKLSGQKQGLESSAFPALFRLLTAEEGANISQIDIACDDREGYLDMDEIVCKIQSNEVNSRMARRSVIVSYDGAQRGGTTVYLGAPSSDFRVRIYDKAKEEGIDGHWLRVELVMRHKNSAAFVSQAVDCESIGRLTAQVINDKFQFIKRDDSNITRCTVCAWWLRFVDELEAVRLVARCVIQHRVEQLDDWVINQVGPSLAVLFVLWPGPTCLSWPGTPENGFQISKKRSFQTIIISNLPASAPGNVVMPRGSARD